MQAERLVSHQEICQACKVLGLPEPKPDSQSIEIEIHPFGGGPYLAPIHMKERRVIVTACPVPHESVPDASGAVDTPASSRLQ